MNKRPPDDTEDENVPNDHGDRKKLRHENARERSSSDPCSDRQISRYRDRRRHDVLSNTSNNDEDVVLLPDRFDSSGRPLDQQDQDLHRPRTSHGELEYLPQYPGDLSMHGLLAISSIDDPLDMVHFARTVGGLLQRQHGLIGILGHMLQDEFGRRIG